MICICCRSCVYVLCIHHLPPPLLHVACRGKTGLHISEIFPLLAAGTIIPHNFSFQTTTPLSVYGMCSPYTKEMQDDWTIDHQVYPAVPEHAEDQHGQHVSMSIFIGRLHGSRIDPLERSHGCRRTPQRQDTCRFTSAFCCWLAGCRLNRPDRQSK